MSPTGWEHLAVALWAAPPNGANEMMHNPPHPGEVLREDVITPLGLAMSHAAFSRVLNCRAGISPDLALRLEQAGVSTARASMAMQANYDLWQAKRCHIP